MTTEDALRILRSTPADQKAWESLYLAMYHPLLAYVLSLLVSFQIGPSANAQDVVHEVMVAFFQRWSKIRTEIPSVAALNAYLRRSCRNLLVDMYRDNRRAQLLVDFLSLDFGRAFGNESEVYRSIFVREIIEALPRECASLLQQYVEEDLSPAELADRENESPATFYSRWYRCIQRAKEIFVQKKGVPKRL